EMAVRPVGVGNTKAALGAAFDRSGKRGSNPRPSAWEAVDRLSESAVWRGLRDGLRGQWQTWGKRSRVQGREKKWAGACKNVNARLYLHRQRTNGDPATPEIQGAQ